MRVRNHGKYTHMRKSNPRAIARCDYSGLMVSQHTMLRQLEYRGSGLVWTGYYVDPHFADRPNPQNLIPLIIPDPIPIINARPDNEVDVIVPRILNLGVGGNSDVTLTEDQFSNLQFIFTGVLTGNITIFVPSTYNEFRVFNKTTGAFTVSMQIQGVVPSLKVLPAESLIFCDCFNLTFIPMN